MKAAAIHPVRRRGALAALTVVAASALLLGCATATPDVDPTESAPPVAETAPETPAEVSGSACLTGTWQLRNDTFEAAMKSLILNSPETPPEAKGLGIAISGDSFIRFDGVELYTAWQDAFTMTMSMNGGKTEHVQESQVAGNYEATDDHVWVFDMQVISQSAVMHLDGIGSVAQDSSAPGMASIDFFGYTDTIPNVDPEFVDGAAAYTCGSDELTLHSDAGMTASFSRTTSE